MLNFISNSVEKYNEIKSFIPDIQWLKVDLVEIQSLSPKEIIEAKLVEAKCQYDGEFLVEDTSLSIQSLGGLPGPFIKWFLKSLGVDGLYNLIENFNDHSAEAHTYFGYLNSSGQAKFYHGYLKGEIVSPRGNQGFGWDSLFQPEGWHLTLAEMSLAQKESISMRTKALEAFLKDRELF